jgi:hypothetical protein
MGKGSAVEAEGGRPLAGDSSASSLSNTENKTNESEESYTKKGRLRSFNELRKLRYLAKVEVREFVRAKGGLKNCVFLTFTTVDNCTEKSEFERRVNNVLTGVLRKACNGEYLMYRERQERGAWHIHVITDGGGDVRKGTKWGYNRKYKRMEVVRPNEKLRVWWRLCEKVRLSYDGFGRCSAEPLGKTNDNVENSCGYVTKYVTKERSGRGERCISYGRKLARATNRRCSMMTESAADWRSRCKKFALAMRSLFRSVSDDQIWGVIKQMMKDNMYKMEATKEEMAKVAENYMKQCVRMRAFDMFPESWNDGEEFNRCWLGGGDVYVMIPFMTKFKEIVVDRNGQVPRDNPYAYG